MVVGADIDWHPFFISDNDYKQLKEARRFFVIPAEL